MLRLRSQWILRAGTILALAVAFVLAATPVYAVDPADPDDDPTFPYIYANRSLLETNDFLLVAEYNLPYAVLPADPANINYIFELIDTDGVTKLGMALPYPYAAFDNGYNKGAVSWYFDAADFVALGMTWSDGFTIRVAQNPAKFATPTVYNTAVGATAYSSVANTQTAQRAELAERVKVIATDLQTYYAVTLLSEQDTLTVFSSYGEAYFRQAIAGLQSLAPSIFFLQSASADTSSRVWGSTLSDTYKERLFGVDTLPGTADDHWIYTSLARVADDLNIPWMLLMGLICIAVCVLVIKVSNEKFFTPLPGYAGSLIVVSGFSMLALGMTLAGLIALAVTFIGGWFMFMRHA